MKVFCLPQKDHPPELITQGFIQTITKCFPYWNLIFFSCQGIMQSKRPENYVKKSCQSSPSAASGIVHLNKEL